MKIKWKCPVCGDEGILYGKLKEVMYCSECGNYFSRSEIAFYAKTEDV